MDVDALLSTTRAVLAEINRTISDCQNEELLPAEEKFEAFMKSGNHYEGALIASNQLIPALKKMIGLYLRCEHKRADLTLELINHIKKNKVTTPPVEKIKKIVPKKELVAKKVEPPVIQKSEKREEIKKEDAKKVEQSHVDKTEQIIDELLETNRMRKKMREGGI